MECQCDTIIANPNLCLGFMQHIINMKKYQQLEPKFGLKLVCIGTRIYV